MAMERRGAPKVVLLSIRDYVNLAAPEPEVLKLLGEDSERKRTNTLTDGQINAVIEAARAKSYSRK